MALSDSAPEPLPAELAPFMVQAKAHIEQATDGLAPEAAIAHLEAAVTRAAIEASRLGFEIPLPDLGEPTDTSETEGPVVIVQRLGGPAGPEQRT